MRKLAMDLLEGGASGKFQINNALAKEFYEWLKPLVDSGEELPKDLCSLRRMFYHAKSGEAYITKSEK